MTYWGGKDKKKKGKTSDTSKPQVQPRTSEKKKVVVESDSEVNLNENESELTTFLIQTRTLLWKNFLLFKRKTRIILFVTLAPFVVGYFLTLVLTIGTSFEDTGKVDGIIDPIGKVIHCTEKETFIEGVDDPCVSVGYGIIGPQPNVYHDSYSRYHDIMKILSRNNDFEYGSDVKPLEISNHNSLEKYFDEN